MPFSSHQEMEKLAGCGGRLADAVLAACRDGLVDADLIKAQALDRFSNS
jgi:hypothetical protein